MPKILKKLIEKGKKKEILTTSPLIEASGSRETPTTLRLDDTSPVPMSTKNEQQIGMFELSANGSEKLIDVVAVHGLQGDAYKTWEHENGSLWLQDFLPADLPEARIMTFGYDSTVAVSKSVANIEDKALELLNALSSERVPAPGCQSRPIVFICHSLGGIVVKKALILAHERNSNPEFKDILDNTKAIAFLGVPHQGSNSAWWATVAASFLKSASIGTSTNTAVVSDLVKGSTTLANISMQFLDRTQDMVIWTFYEMYKLYGVEVVNKSSASIGLRNESLYPVNADHRTICKTPSATSHEYRSVGRRIARKTQDVLAKALPHGRANISYFSIPNRRVRQFVGRKEILQRIDEALSSGPGPRIAVLQGMGGQGKTQIALEYCHRMKNTRYSAIFWVDATTNASAEISFKAIHEKIKSQADALADMQEIVDSVLQRLGSWTSQWLLVFDNYDNLEAFPNIEDFFPEGELGAFLVTSRHASSSRLALSPSNSYIKLDGLDEDDAVVLLIQESETKDPDYFKDANQIVKRLGCHPLAITQAGTYIAKRDLRLSKFVREYEERRRLILDNTPQNSRYMKKLDNADRETALNVFTTCELSFQQLQSKAPKNDHEAKLLTLFAFFDKTSISEQLFVEFIANKGKELESTRQLTWLGAFTSADGKWDGHSFEDALISLRDLSLLQDFTKKDRFFYSSLHPLVQDWLRLRVDKPTARENISLAMMLLQVTLDKKLLYERLSPSLTKMTIMSHLHALVGSCKEFDIPYADVTSDQRIFEKIGGIQTIKDRITDNLVKFADRIGTNGSNNCIIHIRSASIHGSASRAEG